MARKHLTKHYINYKDGRVYALYYKATHTIYYNLTCDDNGRVIVFNVR